MKIINDYLYEIIEDYKSAESRQEKDEIFASFCNEIWSCDNKRKSSVRKIRFSIRKDLKETEIGQLFDRFSSLEYTGCKSLSKETDWPSLIRQKINNLYSRYFDKEIILEKEYLNLLATPKKLYYQWAGGREMDPVQLEETLNTAVKDAEKLRISCQKKKMELSWQEYKKIIESFLRKIFHTCKQIENYDNETGSAAIYDFISEDHFYIRYFCKSLSHYMLNYRKDYYGLKRGRNKRYTTCLLCGKLIEKTNNRILYCESCRKERNRKKTRENMRNIRKV